MGGRPLQHVEIGVVAGAERQWQVQVGADPLPLAALVGVAPDEGVEAARIGVERDGEHRGVAVEDALRAVAVMHVDVEHRDPGVALAQGSGGDRAVVEVAVSPGPVAIGVMAGRAAERVGRVLAVEHELRGARRDVGGGSGGRVGARPDRAGGVDRVPAEPPNDVGRVGRGLAHRVDVGDHLRAVIRQRLPFLPGLRQEGEVVRAVDPGPGAGAVGLRRHHRVVSGLQPGEQAVGPFRLVGGGLHLAAHQEELRVVAAMVLGMNGLHGVSDVSLRGGGPCGVRLSSSRTTSRRATPIWWSTWATIRSGWPASIAASTGSWVRAISSGSS